MKKCTFCGGEASDEATVCAIDGQPVIDPTAPEAAPPEPTPLAGPAPIFGLLSVTAPLIGWLVYVALILVFGSFFDFIIWSVLLVPLSPFCGLFHHHDFEASRAICGPAVAWLACQFGHPIDSLRATESSRWIFWLLKT